MNLKCNIKGIEYQLVQGVTFTEEYNETLDSATIMISQIPMIKDLKPYDDVYIYDFEMPTTNYKGRGNMKLKVEESYRFLDPKLQVPNGYSTDISYFKLKDKKHRQYGEYDFSIIDSNTCELRNSDAVILGTKNGNYWVFNQEEVEIFKDGAIAEVQYEKDVGVNYNRFYKHLLVDQFTETLINLSEGLYKYKIELFSETKGLEVVQLPNISITQPRNLNKRRNVSSCLKDFVYSFSPKIKMNFNKDVDYFDYVPKYIVSDDVLEIFKDVYSPDFTLNNPNLRDVLAQLMLTKDMIPYVEDNVIKALDITKRNGPFNNDKRYVNYINGSRSSENHCDSLRRTYNNALSQDNTAKMVEFLGFRNDQEALLTLDNMYIQTRYPIYKINKVYMCYYKKGKIITNLSEINKKETKYVEVRDYDQSSFIIRVEGLVKGEPTYSCTNSNISVYFTVSKNEKFRKSSIYVNYGTTSSNTETGYITVNYSYEPQNYNTGTEISFLCKQDITPLVKLNAERSLLSSDWNDFTNKNTPTNIEEMAKYKICTVGYDIGSNKITGWGTKYTYPEYWWERTKTYIQNIYEKVDVFTPYGIYQYGYLTNINNDFKLKDEERIILEQGYISPFTNDSLKQKGFFFQVDYNAFYNGCVVHSKDIDSNDSITINDNSSSSLTLLEQDGLFQKEKINRFGNKALTINARYEDISQLQPLGSVYGNELEDDFIIYHKEYNIYNNTINCIYYATKDYVLKNYYTSVYSKHRPYNLLSYGESVTRSENRKIILLLSTQEMPKEPDLPIYIENNDTFLPMLFSFAENTEKPKSIDVFEEKNKYNCGLIDRNYLSDVNGFVSGYSLCFNMRMYDNVSGGVYIKEKEPSFNTNPTDDFTGSVQDWYLDVDDEETGGKSIMTFELFHLDNNPYFGDNILIENPNENIEKYYQKLFALPKLEIAGEDKKNRIRVTDFINKDNKEVIDMTFQFEPISAEPNKIIFSQWMLKLSDLLSGYNKFGNPIKVVNEWGHQKQQELKYATMKTYTIDGDEIYEPIIMLQFDVDYFNSIDKNKKKTIDGFVEYNINLDSYVYYITFRCIKYSLKLEEIVKYTNDYIDVKCFQICIIKSAITGTEKIYSDIVTYRFKKVSQIGSTIFDRNKVVFSNKTQFKSYTYPYQESKPYYIGEDGKQYFFNTVLSFATNDFVCSNKKDVFADNNKISDESITFSVLKCMSESLEEKTYFKNSFIILDNEEIKKEIVYNEYVTLPNKSDLAPNTVINVHSNEIFINLNGIPETTKSIQHWYLDNVKYSRKANSSGDGPGSWTSDDSKSSYKFVFGVNLTQEDFNRGYVRIYINPLRSRDKRVFDYSFRLLKGGDNNNDGNDIIK